MPTQYRDVKRRYCKKKSLDYGVNEPDVLRCSVLLWEILCNSVRSKCSYTVSG